jgi:hypothetical protein
MAREKRYVPPAFEQPAQEEMTVVVVKFKGGPESMQKGFDAVNNAIASLGPTQPVHQRVAASHPLAQLPPAPSQNGYVLNAEVEEQEVEVSDPVPEVRPPTASAPAPKPRKPYSFLSDFNLAPDGVPSLKEYCAAKSVQSDNDKFLVASAWIQTYGGTDPFTGNHLFTVFRAMDWKIQTDMTQPLRRLKSEKSYFENPGGGKWRLTGIGLEAAERVGK